MSTLRVNTLQNTSGVEVYTAKAWVNFNGTGTVAIRAAGNVSSITDRGTGYYTVNLTSAMTDANFAFTGMAEQVGGDLVCVTKENGVSTTTTTLPINTKRGTSSSDVDSAVVCIAIFR